mmetsp:Transcript_27223/g.82647  ORF Transcript_27223/g.82647 Transcript_27223/m.82647 type:complete len:126 (-) Transcript_27223:381-758(-)
MIFFGGLFGVPTILLLLVLLLLQQWRLDDMAEAPVPPVHASNAASLPPFCFTLPLQATLAPAAAPSSGHRSGMLACLCGARPPSGGTRGAPGAFGGSGEGIESKLLLWCASIPVFDPKPLSGEAR